jgi:hypothetical protein
MERKINYFILFYFLFFIYLFCLFIAFDIAVYCIFSVILLGNFAPYIFNIA